MAPPFTEPPPPGKDGIPWGQHPPPPRPKDGNPGEQNEWIIDRCKNSSLLQNSFAGGNKWNDLVNVDHMYAASWCKMMSLVNKSADWLPPDYHKTARTFPQILFIPNSLNKLTLNERCEWTFILIFMVMFYLANDVFVCLESWQTLLCVYRVDVLLTRGALGRVVLSSWRFSELTNLAKLGMSRDEREHSVTL